MSTERVQELVKAFNRQTGFNGFRGEAILRMAANCYQDRQSIVEVGVFSGSLSEWILRMLPAATLTMVDRWAVCGPIDDVTTPLDQSEWDDIRCVATQRVQRFGDRARIIHMPSVEAAATVPDGSADVVFIDADHTYEGCAADVAAWWPKVKPGGYLSGHDWGYPATDIGVERAVREFCKREGVEVRVISLDYVWIVRKAATNV
jgi:predicted O-methyltransferase YrrM